MKHLAKTVAATIALLPCPAAALLSGATVSEEYRFPTTATPYGPTTYSPQTFVVGAGQESSILLEGVTTFYVDFSDMTLLLPFDTTLSNPTFNSAPFNGLVFTSTAFAQVTGVTVNANTNFTGFDNSRVSIVGNDLWLNWNGLTYDTNTVVGLTFTGPATAVPEPATWALMIGGFGAVGLAMRRRRKTREAVTGVGPATSDGFAARAIDRSSAVFAD